MHAFRFLLFFAVAFGGAATLSGAVKFGAVATDPAGPAFLPSGGTVNVELEYDTDEAVVVNFRVVVEGEVLAPAAADLGATFSGSGTLTRAITLPTLPIGSQVEAIIVFAENAARDRFRAWYRFPVNWVIGPGRLELLAVSPKSPAILRPFPGDNVEIVFAWSPDPGDGLVLAERASFVLTRGGEVPVFTSSYQAGLSVPVASTAFVSMNTVVEPTDGLRVQLFRTDTAAVTASLFVPMEYAWSTSALTDFRVTSRDVDEGRYETAVDYISGEVTGIRPIPRPVVQHPDVGTFDYTWSGVNPQFGSGTINSFVDLRSPEDRAVKGIFIRLLSGGSSFLDAMTFPVEPPWHPISPIEVLTTGFFPRVDASGFDAYLADPGVRVAGAVPLYQRVSTSFIYGKTTPDDLIVFVRPGREGVNVPGYGADGGAIATGEFGSAEKGFVLREEGLMEEIRFEATSYPVQGFGRWKIYFPTDLLFEGPAIEIVSVEAVGDEIEMAFRARFGFHYRLERRTEASDWDPVSSLVQGWGDVLSFSASMGRDRAFFRLTGFAPNEPTID